MRKGRQHNPGLAYNKVAPSIRRSTDGVAPRSGPLGLMQGFANAWQSLAPRQAGLPQTFTKIRAKTDEYADGLEPKHGHAAAGLTNRATLPTVKNRRPSGNPDCRPTGPTGTILMPNDLHTRVAAAILEQLETADPASWTLPWHGADPMPCNASTVRRYRGINILALWCAAQANGYTDARWATYRQWTALGAQVRRAERSTLVLFYKELPRGTDAAAETNGSKKPGSVPFVARAANVFNVAQVDTAPTQVVLPSSGTTILPPPAFDSFVTDTGATIHEGGTRACYVPATDTIRMPTRTTFHSTEGYAGTLAHELVHWTGTPHRLARDLTGRFGAHSYAAEELVAELGAAFILADLGIARVPHSNHAAYCASWAPLLRADPHALATAATQGSRAADYLADMQPNAEVLAERSDATGASALVKPSAAATTFLGVSVGSAPMRAANRTRATANRQ